jgi:perosamine synthetase
MIPVNEPLIAKNTLRYVTDCVQSGWISSAGSYIQKFEQQFAGYLKVRHAVTTTSGTTALHLALASLGIGPGDEVVIPALTMIAVPYAVLYTGAKPAIVDVDRDMFNINPEKILEFIQKGCRFDPRKKVLVNKQTNATVKAILPVHLYGHPCPMDRIMAIAREYSLRVVEDAAEAHGALFYPDGNPKKAQYAGAIGEIGCFSFYANKIVTTGEGGMVVTNDDKVAERARSLKDLAHAPQKRFLHTELAFNYRMTNVQAAIGAAQLEEIEKYIEIKQDMAAAYKELLSGVRGLALPCQKEWARNVYWMYAVLVEKEFGLARDEVMKKLKAEGIDTRTFFIPVHEQPVFAKEREYQGLSFPVAEELSRIGFYLPSGLALTKSQIEEVCQAIKRISVSSPGA